MQFEAKLHLLFKKQRDVHLLDIPRVDTINYENIKSIIDEMHTEYESKGVSYENDLYSTLNAVDTLSCLMVSHCFDVYGLPVIA